MPDTVSATFNAYYASQQQRMHEEAQRAVANFNTRHTSGYFHATRDNMNIRAAALQQEAYLSSRYEVLVIERNVNSEDERYNQRVRFTDHLYLEAWKEALTWMEQYANWRPHHAISDEVLPVEQAWSANAPMWEWVGDPRENPALRDHAQIVLSEPYAVMYCHGCDQRFRSDTITPCETCLASLCENCNANHNHDGAYCGACGYGVNSNAGVEHCYNCDEDYCRNHEYYHEHEEEYEDDDYGYDGRPAVIGMGREASMNYIDNAYTPHELARGQRSATVELEAEYMGNGGNELRLDRACGITTDGSLSNGVEVTLPPSRGAELVEFMRDTCQKMIDGGYGIKYSCGMHAHLDLRDKTNDPKFFAHLFNAFYAFEDILFAMQSEERHLGEYSIPLRQKYAFYEMYGQQTEHFDYNFYKQDKTPSGKMRMESEKGHKYASPRYASINFHSVYFRGSLEVRIHEGTLDADNALRWIDLLQFIIARVERSHSYKYMARMARMDVTEAKVAHFFRYFKIPKDLRVWVLDRIRNGQGFGFHLGTFQWGTPKKGRAKAVRNTHRLPHVGRSVACNGCTYTWRLRATHTRCPNCRRILFDDYYSETRYSLVVNAQDTLSSFTEYARETQAAFEALSQAQWWINSPDDEAEQAIESSPFITLNDGF